MEHKHNMRTLNQRCGIEYDGLFRRNENSDKLCARFTDNNGKEIWRNIYKSNGNEYVKFFGIEWFFD